MIYSRRIGENRGLTSRWSAQGLLLRCDPPNLLATHGFRVVPSVGTCGVVFVVEDGRGTGGGM